LVGVPPLPEIQLDGPGSNLGGHRGAAEDRFGLDARNPGTSMVELLTRNEHIGPRYSRRLILRPRKFAPEQVVEFSTCLADAILVE
jgi:hypothetical protein